MEQDQIGSPFLTGSPAPNEEQRTLAMLAHIVGIVAPVLFPLVIMIVRGKDSAWLNNQAKEAINFQAVCLIGYLLSSPLVICIGLGYLTATAVFLMSVVLGFMAGLKAKDGAFFKYPVSVPLAK